MEPPVPVKGPTLFSKVRHSGQGDWGLQFSASITRDKSHIGCHLTRRKNVQPAGRIYDRLVTELEGLRTEMGTDLETWDENGRPRLGFRRKDDFAFLSAGSGDKAFAQAVAWMQERLDRLVSTLNPHLQRMIAENS